MDLGSPARASAAARSTSSLPSAPRRWRSRSPPASRAASDAARRSGPASPRTAPPPSRPVPPETGRRAGRFPRAASDSVRVGSGAGSREGGRAGLRGLVPGRRALLRPPLEQQELRLLAASRDDEEARLAPRLLHRLAQVVEVGDRMALDALDHVADEDPGLRGRRAALDEVHEGAVVDGEAVLADQVRRQLLHVEAGLRLLLGRLDARLLADVDHHGLRLALAQDLDADILARRGGR